ncbi:MAG: UDP-glucose dehydrogenase family protein [Promethearchaeota archaeon]
MEKPRISIIGMGFVGLVSAVCYASRGFNVIATSLEKEIVEKVNNGIAPFYEKDLDEILKSIVEKNMVKATLNNTEAVLNSEISFISVGTPMLEDRSIDLSYINRCSLEIGEALKNKEDYHLIVDRSTIIPGTTRNLIGKNIERVSGKKMGINFGLCMQPEFLREGNAVFDTFHPNRIIIGELDVKSGDILESFWKEFYKDDQIPFLRMNIESAEMVKYANNCFLATKVGFAMDIARICELMPDMDVKDVMNGVGLDDRISPKFLNAGAGFGGSCFPKDVNAIVNFAKTRNFKPRILRSVLDVNDYQAKHIVDIAENLAGKLEGRKVTLLGLSFKPNTDDMREAPSIRIVSQLLSRGVFDIVGFDPRARETARKVFRKRIQYSESVEEALKDSECAIIITEWDDFKILTPEDFKKHMKIPNVVDGRRIFDFKLFSQELNFRAVGRL